jgi:ureidoglycolate hydrolase
VADTDPSDALRHLEFEWADPHVNVIAHRAEEVPRSNGFLCCTEMYRHDTHTQALLVLEVPCVLAVAERTAAFSEPEHAAAVRAFRLEPLQAVVLHRGTWHWGPHPLGAEEVRLFNVQGWRYQEDNHRADLEAVGAAVDIAVGP